MTIKNAPFDRTGSPMKATFSSGALFSFFLLGAQALDTLVGIQGDGFVLLATDAVLHRSLVVMQNDRDKIPVVGKRRMLAVGGPPYMADAISNIIKVEVGIMERRLRHPLSTKAISHMCRRLFLEFQGLPCPVMVAGCNEECSSGGKQDEGPKLYWMDTLGAIQRLRYAAHGESSSFLVSLLDRYVGEGRELSLEAALEVLQKCYGELEDRYLVNTGGALQVKVVDRHGCRSLPDIRRRPAKP